MTDEETIERAAQWMRENAESVLQDAVLDADPRTAKECILMAGSPGAGKTETVRQLQLQERFVVLEADEIRVLNPFYRKTTDTEKGNAHLIQKAAGIGLDYCRKYCVNNEIAFVQDTTFSNRGSTDLVRKLVNAEWRITIILVLQDVQKAWEFTKIREAKEGRSIPAESFARSFSGILDNIQQIQEKFPTIQISLVIKDGTDMKESFESIKDPIESVLVDNGIAIPDEDAILKLLQ